MARDRRPESKEQQVLNSQAVKHHTKDDDVENWSPAVSSKANELSGGLITRNGIVLEPQPSNDPRDPLNWSHWKKYSTFGVICFAAFSGLATTLAQNSSLVVQAKTYNVSPTEMSYAVTAAIAGLMAGPFLIVPLARVIGVSSVIFWSVWGILVCAVWAGCMTRPDDYIAFVMSRLFAGLFGAIPQILGNGVIQNIFFRHERGRAFAIYSTSYILGTAAGPTFGGFIIQYVDWPYTFWWTVALNGFILVLIFVFVHETGYLRGGQKSDVELPNGFLANRLATFCPGHKTVPRIANSDFIRLYTVPVQIFFSPAVVLAGFFQFVNFGWNVLINTLLAIYLQTPVAEGGYGFTPQQNAAFLFSIWIGILAAQVYGNLLNDRVPLSIWRKTKGPWRPEFRLHTLWFPGLTMPVGMGLFGAALQYHLHYMVLALGSFIISFAAVASVPVPINYSVESYLRNPQEVGTVMNVYRLLLGFIVPFFMDAWTEAVTIGWVFGMGAFFSILAFGGILLLMWKGERIRGYSLGRVAAGEDGVEDQ